MIKALHFTVSGEFLTKHARSLWADENRPDFALHTLTTSLEGLTEEQAILIVSGKKKITGDSSKGCQLVNDSALKSPAGNPLLSMEGVLTKLLQHNQRLRENLYDVTNPTHSPSPRGLVEIGPYALKRIRAGKSTFEDERARKMESWLERKKVADIEESPSEAYAQAVTLAKKNSPLMKTIAGSELLERFMSQVKRNDADAEKPPHQDPKLESKNGWVDRAGGFWPCNYMGHIALAMRLGEKEVSLEEQGWLKISDSQDPLCIVERDSDVMGVLHEGRYSDAQKSTVREWCNKHGRRFPKWLTDEN